MARITVVGPGALGILFAARLAEAGHEVTLGCRTAKAARLLAAKGLVATDHRGHEVRVEVATATRPSGPAPDLVVLATKCAAAERVAKQWGQGPMPVVGLQNGIIGPRLQAILGSRFVDCTVAVPATRTAEGHSVQTGPGGIHVGPWPRGWTPEAATAARLLEAVLPVQQARNMEGVRWTKLLINSASTGLGVAAGVGLGDLLQDRAARRAFAAILVEGHAAGRAAGVRFEPVLGFRPGMISRLSRLGPVLPDAIIRIIGRKYRRMRSSGLQDLERGIKTEVDELNGHIVRVAATHGVLTPVNGAAVETVHAIEAGRLKPGPEALARITSFHSGLGNPSRRTRR